MKKLRFDINDPLPWDIVCDLYYQRTGERITAHSARGHASQAIRKLRERLIDTKEHEHEQANERAA